MNDLIPAVHPRIGIGATAKKARRKLFVAAYLANGGNGRQAAISAGWSESSASAMAGMLLKEPSVMAQLEVAARMAANLMGLTVERTLEEIARLAYASPKRLFAEDGRILGIHELDDETAATVSSVEVEKLFEGRGDAREQVGTTTKIKTWDKNAALEKAMKFHGLYTEKVEHTGTVIIQAHRLDADV